MTICVAPRLRAALRESALAAWAERLPEQTAAALDPRRDGRLPALLTALYELEALCAPLRPARVELDADRVCIGAAADCDPPTRRRIEALLQRLHPWRKGPFSFFGIAIDAEWRADWKWARLAPHIAALAGRRALDVGCGNGYYALRMAGAGAAQVIGLEPAVHPFIQFQALRRALPESLPVDLLPMPFEALPAESAAFDSVFSMGVLYHRRDPLEHLRALRGALRDGGELILETLAIDGDRDAVLRPPGRYARMRNVWSIPSLRALERWLGESGFRRVRLINLVATTPEEQRPTAWMRFESLAQALDPRSPERTIEGLPAPRRALFLANR